MPPRYDTKDGPIVSAARRALEEGNVNLVLIRVPEEAEGEVRVALPDPPGEKARPSKI